jgi:hypothetical protein
VTNKASIRPVAASNDIANPGEAVVVASKELPAVYPFRVFVADGGLTSYGANAADSYRRAAS